MVSASSKTATRVRKDTVVVNHALFLKPPALAGRIVTIATHRIALDPNARQERLLRQHAEYARFAWNWGVEETRRALDAVEKSPTSHYRLRPAFNAAKGDVAPWSKALSQNAAKYALIDLAKAWERFWRQREAAKKAGGKPGRRYQPLRFKSRKRSMVFRADNGPGTVRTEGRVIHLPKIGAVRLREACRFGGPVRECTVKHDGVRWHVAVVCEIPEARRKETGAVVGVDVGLRRLATVHDGETVSVFENPRALKGALVKLRRIRRRIAKSLELHGRTLKSNRRERRYAEFRRQHLRVANLRVDAAHKATTAIAKRSRLVCVESLHVPRWMQNRRLARSIADASPSRLLSLLEWKCRREGVRLLEREPVDRSGSMCTACGAVHNELQMERRRRCPACGAAHDRSAGAALNLYRQGLAADVEGVSDGRSAAAPGEASTRRIVPDVSG